MARTLQRKSIPRAHAKKGRRKGRSNSEKNFIKPTGEKELIQPMNESIMKLQHEVLTAELYTGKKCSSCLR